MDMGILYYIHIAAYSIGFVFALFSIMLLASVASVTDKCEKNRYRIFFFKPKDMHVFSSIPDSEHVYKIPIDDGEDSKAFSGMTYDIKCIHCGMVRTRFLLVSKERAEKVPENRTHKFVRGGSSTG